ncbi:MAG: hypothetical protein FJW92_07110 [Actinobacteria bacterium]|nr:hypothetical protein [Actinomycetota bacterium]
MPGTDLTRRERVLRRWIIALAAIAGVMLILVMAVVLYWLRFVLPTEPDPFSAGHGWRRCPPRRRASRGRWIPNSRCR